MTAFQRSENLSVERHDNVFVIIMRRSPENRLNAPFCQEIISAFHRIQRELGASEGAVITRGSDAKFWCTGLELEDPDPWANCDGFYPVSTSIVTRPRGVEC
jgi:enoyl-CoA hydratase/carnithine racemase